MEPFGDARRGCLNHRNKIERDGAARVWMHLGANPSGGGREQRWSQ